MADDKPKKEKVESKQKGFTSSKGRIEEKRRMRVVIRVLGTDLDGEKGVKTAILKIKGVNHTFANAICKAAKIDPSKKLGSFAESEIKELEKAISNPIEYGIPIWIVNRRKDVETGKDMHVSSSGVIVSKKFDVQRMIDKKIYKGVRHMLGLPVRGQRTRSSFRKGKTVGVVRKSARIAGAGKKDKK